jgi:MFS family permease
VVPKRSRLTSSLKRPFPAGRNIEESDLLRYPIRPVIHLAMDSNEQPLRRVFPPILLPMFLAVVDVTIVAAALPAMAASFGDVQRVSWVVASYLVASTVVAPVYGRLGDALGRRRLLLVALMIFVSASVLCALAKGVLSLTAARVLQGFGGGGLMVLSQALLGETVSRRQLGLAQGVTAAVIVASSSFGPVAGGALIFKRWTRLIVRSLQSRRREQSGCKTRSRP